MVALYGGGAFGSGFNNVGVNCSLCKEFRVAVLCGFLVEDVDEVFADDFALLFRFGYAVKSGKEAAFGIYANESKVAGAECGFNFIAFVFAHKAGIDENADSLSGNGLRQKSGANGGVNAAGKTENNALVSDLLADSGNLFFNEIVHVVVAKGVAVVVDKVAEHGFAVFGGVHLRVELGSHKAPAFVNNGGKGAVLGGGGKGKALRHGNNAVGVAHQNKLLLVKSLEKLHLRVDFHSGSAVFAGGAGLNLSAEGIGHKLCAVANSHNGNAEIENFRVAAQGFVRINAVGASGEDDADGRKLLYFLRRDISGFYQRVYMALPHPSGDQLLILPAEIQNQNRL